MKTRRLLLLITLAFVPLVASGAKPLVPGRPEYASPEDYTVLRGKITIETIDEHLIGVFVDELQEKGQTAKYRHLFRLQTTQSVSPFRVVSASGSLEFRGNEVVILGTDNDLFYVLMLPEAEANTPRAIGAKATRYVGFGLNHEIRPIATASPGSRSMATYDVPSSALGTITAAASRKRALEKLSRPPQSIRVALGSLDSASFQ